MSVSAQNFTAADSGWVKIFNGRNFDGLYSRPYEQNIMRPPAAPFSIRYAGTDTAEIRVSSTSGGGHIGTDKSYSHYRVRVRYRFDAVGDGNNAGLTYHNDESVPRMQNRWPRSIECQMKQNETGAAFSIQQVTFTTRVNGSSYTPTGGTVVHACEHDIGNYCVSRQYMGNPIIKPINGNQTRWTRMEVVVRGSDSALHIIDGTTVMRLWDIRIYNDGNGTPDGPYGSGGLAVQAEGALISYRDWEIMEFPAETPMTAHYLHRLFLDNPREGVTLTANTPYQVRWRTIGSVPTVNLQYAIGTGTWQTIATGVNNTGSYNWTVPNSPTTQLRLRVTAAAHVQADSSSGDNTITTTSGIIPARELRSLVFMVEGRGIVLENIQQYLRVEILDAAGKAVYSSSVGDRDLRWDLTEASGAKAQPGIFFIRATGNGNSRVERLLNF